jgi:hypothetical protein
MYDILSREIYVNNALYEVLIDSLIKEIYRNSSGANFE